jgi:hypothetical protein
MPRTRSAVAGDRHVVAASSWICEQLGRRLFRRRVVGLLAGQPTRHATDHPIEDRQQVATGRRREQREHQAGVGLGEHAVRISSATTAAMRT